MKTIIDNLRSNRTLKAVEYKQLLSCTNQEVINYLHQQAREVALSQFGNRIYIRGLIEISNFCRNDCFYCGIRKSNTNVRRYRLNENSILDCCKQGYALGFRTFVLQGGEDAGISDEKTEHVVASIRKIYPDCAITLSLGERPKEVYERFFTAGANRYLLRHETSNETHYKRLHPEKMSYENRLRCLNDLKAIGFQVGTGIMVGSPFQTIDNLVEDILFIEKFHPEMIGIGPFIPHRKTPFADYPAGNVQLTLTLLSIFRLIHPAALIPSTTALNTIDSKGREKGILAGANVIMPNLTPGDQRNNYELYNNKTFQGAEAAEGLEILRKRMQAIGYEISQQRGDYNNMPINQYANVPINGHNSSEAEQFINHREIMETLEFANLHKNDRNLIEQLIDKAAECKGLTHREAAVLLECEQPDLIEHIFNTARNIKQKIYGNRIVMFAPLYLSNYCVNSCRYCPYHLKNKTIHRKILTQEEIQQEVIALQNMGHKRLALEAGEDSMHSPIEYILESIETIYSIKHKNGAIRRVNVNIAATSVENYRRLKDAGIGTYILFQETYHKERYEQLHPIGPKSNYAYHTEAMDRAMQGGIDDVGLGVLFGLSPYRYDLVGLLMHAEHLEAAFGVGPHTISVPRICPADDINTNNYPDAVPDDVFRRIVAIIRMAVPYTGMIISTRESQSSREQLLDIGISQISGGSKTGVGDYSNLHTLSENTSQFEVSDNRTLDDIVAWLLQRGHIPSFCTACYREGRTGDRFMSLAKSGQIANCCAPNALMTLKEYLEDYASETTRKLGEKIIEKDVFLIPNLQVQKICLHNLREIGEGKRDFRF